MKAGIPTLGDSGLKEVVSPHFGRAPTFTIVEIESGEADVIPNTSKHMGGTGKPPEILAEAGVDVMFCSGLGPRAIRMFEQYGIRVFVGAGETVEETLSLWREGKLREATDKDACERHRHSAKASGKQGRKFIA